MFAGTALLAYVAGVLTVNHSKPATWEECMVRHLEDVHTSGSIGVLARYCNVYPKGQVRTAPPPAGPWQKFDPQSAVPAD